MCQFVESLGSVQRGILLMFSVFIVFIQWIWSLLPNSIILNPLEPAAKSEERFSLFRIRQIIYLIQLQLCCFQVCPICSIYLIVMVCIQYSICGLQSQDLYKISAYIHNWPFQPFSQDYDLASYTTHCVNFIHEWRNLHFNVDSERQIFGETFHGNFIYSRSLCQRHSPKKYFRIVANADRGLMVYIIGHYNP